MTEPLKTATQVLAELNGKRAAPAPDPDSQQYVDAVNFVMSGIHENIVSNKVPLEIATPALVQLTANYVAACPVKLNGAVDDYRRRLVAARNELNKRKAQDLAATAGGKENGNAPSDDKH